MADLEATTRKRNISGEDLEVAVLDNRLVKKDEEVDLPVYYAWHRDPSGDPESEDYDPGVDGRVGYSPSVWQDVAPTSDVTSTPALSAPAGSSEE